MVRTTHKSRVIACGVKRHHGSATCKQCQRARKIRRNNTSIKQHRNKVFGSY